MICINYVKYVYQISTYCSTYYQYYIKPFVKAFFAYLRDFCESKVVFFIAESGKLGLYHTITMWKCQDTVVQSIPFSNYFLSIISYLCKFICRFIPLKQFAFDDLMSPKYQKLKVDKLPIIIEPVKQDYSFFLEYYRKRYVKSLKPVNRRNDRSVPDSVVCPFCGAPHEYIYDNNGGKSRFQYTIRKYISEQPYLLFLSIQTLSPFLYL